MIKNCIHTVGHWDDYVDDYNYFITINEGLDQDYFSKHIGDLTVFKYCPHCGEKL